MHTYCYTLDMDGRERQLPSAKHPDQRAAIEWGRKLLDQALSDNHPSTAYVAVFQDEGVDDEPLGAWDWRLEEPHPVWSAEE